MLRDPDADLNQVPRQQLRLLLGHIERPGQSLSNIVRRSAGVPFACTAFFQADMCTARKVRVAAVACLLRPLLTQSLPGKPALLVPRKGQQSVQPACPHDSSSRCVSLQTASLAELPVLVCQCCMSSLSSDMKTAQVSHGVTS